MLIPSIDLMGGRIVQLEQGTRLVLESDDLDGWIARFAAYPLIQVIDLDAAMNRSNNRALVDEICGRLPCQVGGGVRSVERAHSLIKAGAKRVIVGSALYDAGGVNIEAAAAFSDSIGTEALVAAIDSKANKVVINGWVDAATVSPEDAMAELDPFVGGFLYTDVNREGLLRGFDLSVATMLRAKTTRRLIVAGGIRSQSEIQALERLNVDAVVGMAIYKGLLVG